MPSHGHAGIDLQAPFVIHYGLPRAILGPLLRGAKGVAVVTCLFKPRPRAGVAVASEATAPRFSFVVHVPSTFASPVAGRSLKRVKAIDLPTWHLMPVPDPAITEHACFTPQAVVLAPEGAPRLSPLKRPTPPWTFGQGRTHAGGWRCVFED